MNCLDLFSGAGGMSLGLHAAGFAVDGVEPLPHLADLQRPNGLSCVAHDVTTYHPTRSYPLVVGGPPCPDFSYAGKRKGTKTERGQLYEHLLRLADEADARAVLMENVAGLLTAENGTAIKKVLAEFQKRRYHGSVRLMDCSLYGVPQKRFRLIIAGVRGGRAFEFPTPIGSVISIREALGLRGAYRSGRPEDAKGWQGMRWLDVEKPGFTVSTRDNYDLLMPDDDVARAEVEAMRARSGRKPSAAYRLNVEELKVLQGAPGYCLQGKMEEQHYAVGNMVPPPLALALGGALHQVLG